jgi:hypothetical protein
MQYILGSPLFGRAGVLYVLSELVFGKQSVIGADGMFLWSAVFNGA